MELLVLEAIQAATVWVRQVVVVVVEPAVPAALF
jgi:hypothetical protein